MKFEEVMVALRNGERIRRRAWGKDKYIYRGEDYSFYDETGVTCNTFMNFEDVLYDDWEIIKEPKYAWDYIIKNECSCWFWDDETEDAVIGTLRRINFNEKFSYGSNVGDFFWKHCRPVRKDEIKFYEDKEDD